MIRLNELVAYLNDYLQIAQIPDYSGAYNGLQVEGRTEIRKVAVAVDACLYTIDRALEASADLLVVHHGLFWGKTAPLTGTYYQRVERLIHHHLPLYSSHLPLDVHPEVGNNAVLARLLGLEPNGSFLEYQGYPLGVVAYSEESLLAFGQRIERILGVTPQVIAKGSEQVGRVGICTGGAGSLTQKVPHYGVQTFLTGEGPHHSFFDAEELGFNLIYAGHYATETVGVQALATHLEQQFGLETRFIAHPTGL
jgi:dinuclear metal center YbgI/SA1388 family protein